MNALHVYVVYASHKLFGIKKNQPGDIAAILLDCQLCGPPTQAGVPEPEMYDLNAVKERADAASLSFMTASGAMSSARANPRKVSTGMLLW